MRLPLSLAVVSLLLLPATAGAAIVDVRIEGASKTLFEGQVDSGVRLVRASSDTEARKCDGTNNGANPSPSPTATSVAADALALGGQDFDGRWFPDFGDYLISRLGPETRSWGLYRNEQSSSVGGCQLAVAAGDRILWAAGTSGATSGVLRIAVSGANPYSVTATTSAGQPVGGATIVDADAAGNLTSTGAVTDAAGRANVSLPPGFHRLKASRTGYVRSARAAFCTEPCGGVPADLGVRTVPPASTSGVKVSRARVLGSLFPRRLVRVDWTVVRAGVGTRSWSLSADDLSSRARTYRIRARGRTATAASLRLPPGRTYALRFDLIDRLLRPTRSDFGRAIVPVDDRSKAVRRAGRWTKVRASTAWARTVSRGRPGSRFRVRLARGRPTVLVRPRRGSAVLRVKAGRTTRSVHVPAGRAGSHRFVSAFRRARGGTVSFRVVRGTIDLDGVAVSP